MPSFRFPSGRWLQILVAGVVLFFTTEQTLKYTSNLNLLPTVIILGALVVPATFVAYFYSQERALDKTKHAETPATVAVLCFLLGGTLGVVVAGILEYETLRRLSVFGLVSVGFIEESAKLIFPLIIYVRARYRSEIDGLLFGVASGMGFAALETMGYGLVSLLNSQGDIGVLEEVLLVRGLLSPVGHAAWAGLICAVLWRERARTGKSFNAIVIGVFILAAVPHPVGCGGRLK